METGQTTILFDMDGTLIDSTEAILESFDHAFRAMSFKIEDINAVRSLIGYPLEEIFMRFGVPKAEADRFVLAYKNHYRSVATAKTSLLENAREAIKLASSFAKLGIVTTKTSLYTKQILSHFGLLEFFGVVVGRDDVKNPKPNPEPILKALCLLDSDKQTSYMIGDTTLDLIAAKDAGIVGIGVLCGYGTEDELKKLTPHTTSNTLQAVTLIGTFVTK